MTEERRSLSTNVRYQKPLFDAIIYGNFTLEKTKSGCRTSLDTAFKYFAYINIGCLELNGLQLDIWGKSAEIGRDNITRVAFRILNKPAKIHRQVKAWFPLLSSEVSIFLFQKVLKYLRPSENELRQPIYTGTEHWLVSFERTKNIIAFSGNRGAFGTWG